MILIGGSLGDVFGEQAKLLTSDARASSVSSFHLAMTIAAGLVAIGGVAGIAAIRNHPSEGTAPAEDGPLALDGWEGGGEMRASGLRLGATLGS